MLEIVQQSNVYCKATPSQETRGLGGPQFLPGYALDLVWSSAAEPGIIISPRDSGASSSGGRSRR